MGQNIQKSQDGYPNISYIYDNLRANQINTATKQNRYNVYQDPINWSFTNFSSVSLYEQGLRSKKINPTIISEGSSQFNPLNITKIKKKGEATKVEETPYHSDLKSQLAPFGGTLNSKRNESFIMINSNQTQQRAGLIEGKNKKSNQTSISYDYQDQFNQQEPYINTAVITSVFKEVTDLLDDGKIKDMDETAFDLSSQISQINPPKTVIPSNKNMQDLNLMDVSKDTQQILPTVGYVTKRDEATGLMDISKLSLQLEQTDNQIIVNHGSDTSTCNFMVGGDIIESDMTCRDILNNNAYVNIRERDEKLPAIGTIERQSNLEDSREQEILTGQSVISLPQETDRDKNATKSSFNNSKQLTSKNTTSHHLKSRGFNSKKEYRQIKGGMYNLNLSLQGHEIIPDKRNPISEDDTIQNIYQSNRFDQEFQRQKQRIKNKHINYLNQKQHQLQPIKKRDVVADSISPAGSHSIEGKNDDTTITIDFKIDNEEKAMRGQKRRVFFRKSLDSSYTKHKHSKMQNSNYGDEKSLISNSRITKQNVYSQKHKNRMTTTSSYQLYNIQKLNMEYQRSGFNHPTNLKSNCKQMDSLQTPFDQGVEGKEKEISMGLLITNKGREIGRASAGNNHNDGQTRDDSIGEKNQKLNSQNKMQRMQTTVYKLGNLESESVGQESSINRETMKKKQFIQFRRKIDINQFEQMERGAISQKGNKKLSMNNAAYADELYKPLDKKKSVQEKKVSVTPMKSISQNSKLQYTLANGDQASPGKNQDGLRSSEKQSDFEYSKLTTWRMIPMQVNVAKKENIIPKEGEDKKMFSNQSPNIQVPKVEIRGVGLSPKLDGVQTISLSKTISNSMFIKKSSLANNLIKVNMSLKQATKSNKNMKTQADSCNSAEKQDTVGEKMPTSIINDHVQRGNIQMNNTIGNSPYQHNLSSEVDKFYLPYMPSIDENKLSLQNLQESLENLKSSIQKDGYLLSDSKSTKFMLKHINSTNISTQGNIVPDINQNLQNSNRKVEPPKITVKDGKQFYDLNCKQADSRLLSPDGHKKFSMQNKRQMIVEKYIQQCTHFEKRVDRKKNQASRKSSSSESNYIQEPLTDENREINQSQSRLNLEKNSTNKQITQQVKKSKRVSQKTQWLHIKEPGNENQKSSLQLLPLVENEQDYLQKKAFKVLELPPGERSSAQIKILRQYFQTDIHNFFDQFKNYEEETVEHFLGQIELRRMQAGQIVFDYGDPGEEYFITLDGISEILIPFQKDIKLMRPTNSKVKIVCNNQNDTFSSTERSQENGQSLNKLNPSTSTSNSSLGFTLVNKAIKMNQIKAPVRIKDSSSNPQSVQNLLSQEGSMSCSDSFQQSTGRQVEERECTDQELPMELLVYCIFNFKVIAWKMMEQERYNRMEEVDGKQDDNKVEHQTKVMECQMEKQLQQFLDEYPQLLKISQSKLRRKLGQIQDQLNRLPIMRQLFKWANREPKIFNEKNRTFRFNIFSSVKKLGRGKCFGELALINNQGRAARVVCEEDTVYGILNRKAYDKVLAQSLKKEMHQKMEFLSNFRVFSHLSQTKIQKLIYYVQTYKEFTRGQVVFRQGQEDIDGVYLVSEGEFELSQTMGVNQQKAQMQSTKHQNQKGGLEALMKNQLPHQLPVKNKTRHQCRLLLMGVHEVVGLEEVLAQKQKRTATVTCYSLRATAYFISKVDFIRILRSFRFDNTVKEELAIRTSIRKHRINQLKRGLKQFEGSQFEEARQQESKNKNKQIDEIQSSLGLGRDIEDQDFQSKIAKSKKRKNAIQFIGEVPDNPAYREQTRAQYYSSLLKKRKEEGNLLNFSIMDHSPKQRSQSRSPKRGDKKKSSSQENGPVKNIKDERQVQEYNIVFSVNAKDRLTETSIMLTNQSPRKDSAHGEDRGGEKMDSMTRSPKHRTRSLREQGSLKGRGWGGPEKQNISQHHNDVQSYPEIIGEESFQRI